MSILITTMKRADVEGVHQVECACFRTPWSKASFLSELRNSVAYYLVAKDQNRVIGFGGMWILFDEAHVTNIGVLEEYRQLGVGRMLLLMLMEAACRRGAEKMTLEVREGNRIAQHLYQSMGFFQNGFRPRYYEDTGEGALILWNSDIKATIEQRRAMTEQAESQGEGKGRDQA